MVLECAPGPVVVNFSTSRVNEDVARRFGVPFSRAAVGEINVVRAMRAVGATVGGEGNGGVIVPAAHYGRDGTVAALLAASFAAASGGPFSQAAGAFPRYAMRKEKVEGVDWSASREPLLSRFPDAEVDASDGLRFEWPAEWLHVRPSGTEPVVRLIAEAGSEDHAAERCRQAREALVPLGLRPAASTGATGSLDRG
jgi:phosphomannomutase